MSHKGFRRWKLGQIKGAGLPGRREIGSKCLTDRQMGQGEREAESRREIEKQGDVEMREGDRRQIDGGEARVRGKKGSER